MDSTYTYDFPHLLTGVHVVRTADFVATFSLRRSFFVQLEHSDTQQAIQANSAWPSLRGYAWRQPKKLVDELSDKPCNTQPLPPYIM